MKIVHITAGTGNFYCGTCLRDDVLVRGLRKQGHDAMTVPLYLPIVRESRELHESPLFFGGINVFLQQKSTFFRNSPRWIDSVFDLRVLLRVASRMASLTKPRDLGELTLSTLKADNGFQVKELKRLITWLKKQGSPDVVCLSNALLLGFAAPIHRALNVPIVCSLQGEDSFLDNLPSPYAEQCWSILKEHSSSVSAFIAVSRYYGDCLRERLGINSQKMHNIYNGIDLKGFDSLESRSSNHKPVIGYLAQMIPAKGLETLVDAFIVLKERNRIPGLRLHVAGSMTPADRKFVARLKKKLASVNLSEHVRFFPNLERNEKLEFLSELTVLSVPATYGESFGLYVIEALAAGVPVVQPRHAAFPEILQVTGGGILYDPDNLDSMVSSLESFILNEPERIRMGRRGKEVVFQQFSDESMTRNVLKILERVLN